MAGQGALKALLPALRLNLICGFVHPFRWLVGALIRDLDLGPPEGASHN